MNSHEFLSHHPLTDPVPKAQSTRTRTLLLVDLTFGFVSDWRLESTGMDGLVEVDEVPEHHAG